MLSAERMRGYLPLYWPPYVEMQEILKSQGFEIDNLDLEHQYILVDSFILEMREERIKEWEKWLKIPPVGTLEERRLTILNYFGRIIKMSKESIQALVATMYDGAKAIVEFHDSTIWVNVKPLRDRPDLFVMNWKDVKKVFATWKDWLNTDGQWGSTPLYNELYWVLYERKPCHLKLVINRFISNWQEVTFAPQWEQVSNESKSWGELKFRTWENARNEELQAC